MGNPKLASAAPATPGRRPRDRKERIVNAAADLFYRRGYHNVSTGDIAAAVGITAGALYRHFSNKQDLLAHTLIDVFTSSTAEVSRREVTELPEVVDGLARRAASRRDLGVLWNRESRHLDDDRRRAMRVEFYTFVEAFQVAVVRARPELSPADADLLAWCALGALTSSSYHRAELAEGPLGDLLRTMAIGVITTPLPRPEPGPNAHPSREPGLAPRGRRESILAAATTLFNRRGYGSVTMDDIGSHVGVTSTTVYKYFDSKAELLAATVARAAEPLRLAMAHALRSANSPAQGLANALQTYVEFALANHELVGIFVSEVGNLPEAQRHVVRRAQHEYVAEWIGLLRDARPELDPRAAPFVVHGALTVVNDATRTAHLLRRPDLGPALRLIASRVLAIQP